MLFQKQKYSGTILVYTLVLVVMAVFMATAVLNTTTQLYNSSEISTILRDTSRWLDSKAEYVLKYDENLNNTWNGFVDNIWCPLDFSMSGATLQNTNLSSTIRYLSDSILCRANYNGNNVDFYFNAGFTDLERVEYLWEVENVNASTTSLTFSDADSTFLDISASFPLPSDGFDDNFDDDDFSPYMNGGSNLYPDWYTDNDGDARRLGFGYIIPSEDSALQNIYWLNEDVRDVIFDTNENVGANFIPIWNVTNGRVFISSDQDYAISIYELDKDKYIFDGEIALNEAYVSSDLLSGSWYIQNDMTVNQTLTWNEFTFDFSRNDYAIFLENKSQDLLSYSFRVEDDNSWNEAYIIPINYGWGWSYYASNNVIIDDDSGVLIWWDELVSLGSFSISGGTSSSTSPSISGLMWWYDMTSSLYYTESGWRVSQVNDRSGNWRHLIQSDPALRPALQWEWVTWSWYAGSYFDITNPTSIARVYAKLSYDYTTFQDYDYFLSWISGSFWSPRIIWNNGNTNLLRSQLPTDVTVSIDGWPFSDNLSLPLESSVLIFDFANPQDFTSVMWTSIYSARSFKWEFEKLLLYNSVPTTEEEAQIIEYLNHEPLPPATPSETNIVEFDVGDKIVDIPTTWFDSTGFTISVKDFKPLLEKSTYILWIWHDTYFWYISGDRLRLRVEDTTNNLIFQIQPVWFEIGTSYDIDFIVTNTNYELIVDGVTTETGSITFSGNYNMPKNINTSSIGSDSRSGNFELSEITYLDRAWAVIFQENGNASSWNPQLSTWAVVDVP